MIDIAALLPSSVPVPGATLPAFGIPLAGAPDQAAIFADALRLLLGQSGQPAQASALIGGLPSESIPADPAIPWFGGDGSETDDSLPAAITPDGSSDPETDDLSQSLYQAAAGAGSLATPALNITISDEPESGVILPGGSSTYSDVSVLDGASSDTEQTPQPEAASPISSQTQPVQSQSDAVQPAAANLENTTPALASTMTPAQGLADFQFDLTSEAGDNESPAPSITVNAPTNETPAMPAIASAGEMPEAQSASRPAEATASRPILDSQTEAEAFVRKASQINEDIPVKIEITPGQPAKPATAQNIQPPPVSEAPSAPAVVPEPGVAFANAGKMALSAVNPPVSHDAINTPPQAPAEPVAASDASQESILLAKSAQQSPPLDQSATPATAATETAKVMPLVSAPVELTDPRTSKTRTPVQPADQFESKQSSDHSVTGKTDLSNNGRIDFSAVISKPAALPPAPLDTPITDGPARSGNASPKPSAPVTPPVRTSDDAVVPSNRANTNPVSSDQSQAPSAHAASASGQTQAADQTERADAPPPARFQVEIPKPLRVPGQIRVHLDPPELGQVRIDLSSRGDGIIGSLRFQSEQARHIVEREIGQLQKTLRDAGVRVERLEVLATPPSSSRTGLHTHMSNQHSWSQNTASQNAFNGNARGQAGMPARSTAPKEPAQLSAPVRISAYPTMHAGSVNLVA